MIAGITVILAPDNIESDAKKITSMENYLTIGIFIGLVQVLEGYLLLRASGKINIYSSVTSFIEFGWVIATVYYLVNYDFSTPGLAIASAYLSYNILGWIKSKQLMNNLETTEDIIHITIPKPFAVAAMLFGTVYSAACLLALQ